MHIVFDAYGTLWNVSRIEEACREEVGVQAAGALLELWRKKQLEYAFLRTVMGRYVPFERVTADALAFALASLQLQVSAEASRRLVEAWSHPEAYADALPLLQRLTGHQRAILSNGDPGMLARGVEATGMGEHLGAVLSVAPQEHYKPHPDAYQLVCDFWNVDPEDIVFVSSNGWDVAGASHFGFQTIWINRSDLPQEGLGAPRVARVSSLAELPSALDQAGLLSHE